MGAKIGKPQPWLIVRRRLAQRWNIPPWAVDDAPAREIELERRLLGIEAAVAAWSPR